MIPILRLETALGDASVREQIVADARCILRLLDTVDKLTGGTSGATESIQENADHIIECAQKIDAAPVTQQAAPGAPALDLQNDIDMVTGALDLCEPEEQQAFQRILAAVKGGNRG